MPRDQREVTESPLDQGAREATAYSFDFSAAGVGAIVGLPTFALIRSDGVDVSATNLASPTGTLVGLVATSPIVTLLEADRLYQVVARVTHDGAQVAELFCWLRGRA